MSCENAKKRPRRGSQPDNIMMAEVEALLDQKLSQMEQKMQRKIDSMQSEMDAMKERLSRVDELEEKCNSLEDKCASMERSLKVLAGRWEFSAPDIPASHWTDRGLDEWYASDIVDRFVEDINAVVSYLKGSGRFSIRAIGIEDVDSTGEWLLHDDALLLPYWQNLVDAFDLYGHFIDGDGPTYSRGPTVEICNIQLSPAVCSILSPCLKRSKKVRKLQLQSNGFDQSHDGLAFAVGIAQSNPNIETFTWHRNPIDSFDDVQFCLEEIKRHPSMSIVHFIDCFEGDAGYRSLCSLLDGNKIYDTIGVHTNNIRTMGDTHIPDYLASNPPLRSLALGKNKLDDNDAMLIAEALKRNTNLRYLWLDGNEITEVGQNALQNAMYDNTSLNSVADSNHTCLVACDFSATAVTNICSKDSQKNRRSKIYCLLSTRNREKTNVHHFDVEFDDGNSLKLVPKVLESVHNYAPVDVPRPTGKHIAVFKRRNPWPSDRKPSRGTKVLSLSIYFELLRGWKMPSLQSSEGKQRWPE
ncbi:hypothetical protein ACHAXT_010609 [Thalassiosira profunda]